MNCFWRFREQAASVQSHCIFPTLNLVEKKSLGQSTPGGNPTTQVPPEWKSVIWAPRTFQAVTIRTGENKSKQQIYLRNITTPTLRDKGTNSNMFNGSWILTECLRTSKSHKCNQQFTLKLSHRPQFSNFQHSRLGHLRAQDPPPPTQRRLPPLPNAEVSAAQGRAGLGSAGPQEEIIRDMSQSTHQAF